MTELKKERFEQNEKDKDGAGCEHVESLGGQWLQLVRSR